MGKEEILLKEYEVCQSDSNAMITTHWTVVGIFLAVSTGILAWQVKNIASGSIRSNSPDGWIILVFSILMVLITKLLICWLLRVNSLVDANNKAMKKIECLTNMVKRCKPAGNGEIIIIIVYSILILLWLIVGLSWILGSLISTDLGVRAVWIIAGAVWILAGLTAIGLVICLIKKKCLKRKQT